MRKEIIDKAKQEYLELKKFVENYKGTFDELFLEFDDSFNADGDDALPDGGRWFDLNYGKTINTTIYQDCASGKITVSDIVTIWDDGDGTTFSYNEDFFVQEQNGMIDFVSYK